MSGSLETIFQSVRSMFAAHAGGAVPKSDEPGRYYLDTHEVRAKDGYRTAFGGVEIKKTYVAVHLMPVYAHPELLDGTSEGLKKRMQGKSCFNFKAVDPALLGALEALIARGADRFRAEGRLR